MEPLCDNRLDCSQVAKRRCPSESIAGGSGSGCRSDGWALRASAVAPGVASGPGGSEGAPGAASGAGAEPSATSGAPSGAVPMIGAAAGVAAGASVPAPASSSKSTLRSRACCSISSMRSAIALSRKR
eukprot:530784-Prymnesium_polylepis.1